MFLGTILNSKFFNKNCVGFWKFFITNSKTFKKG